MAVEEANRGILAQIAAIEAPAQARIVAQRGQCSTAGPDALGGLGLRPRARRPARPAQVFAPGERDTHAGRSASRWQDRLRGLAAAAARAQSQDDRGLGAARQSRPTRRWCDQHPDARRGLFDAIVFGEQEAGIWMAGSEFFRRYQSVGGETRKRRGESRGSRGDHLCRRRHDPALPRRPALWHALQIVAARWRFPREKSRSSSASGTPRPAATGCWPGRSCGHGCTTGRSTRRRSPPRRPRSATTSIPRRSRPPSLPNAARSDRDSWEGREAPVSR